MNAETKAAARLLITAVGEGRLTSKLALAYLDADLNPDTLTAILQAHDLPQKATPSLPTPWQPIVMPTYIPSYPGVIPPFAPKRDPLSPPWITTSQAGTWPGAAIIPGKLVGGHVKPFRGRYQHP